jgi:hypothetical protein
MMLLFISVYNEWMRLHDLHVEPTIRMQPVQRTPLLCWRFAYCNAMDVPISSIPLPITRGRNSQSCLPDL